MNTPKINRLTYLDDKNKLLAAGVVGYIRTMYYIRLDRKWSVSTFLFMAVHISNEDTPV